MAWSSLVEGGEGSYLPNRQNRDRLSSNFALIQFGIYFINPFSIGPDQQRRSNRTHPLHGLHAGRFPLLLPQREQPAQKLLGRKLAKEDEI